jgi:hypothetical protein
MLSRMNEQHNGDEARKWLIWGLLLAWSTFIPVAVGLVSNFHGTIGPTGLRDVAGSVVIAFTFFGLAVTLLSQVAAIVLLLRSFPVGYRVFSMLSVCWSGIVIFLSAVCMWLLVEQVGVR